MILLNGRASLKRAGLKAIGYFFESVFEDARGDGYYRAVKSFLDGLSGYEDDRTLLLAGIRTHPDGIQMAFRRRRGDIGNCAAGASSSFYTDSSSRNSDNIA
ncbi:hypothetical protein EBB07_13410 [Paenibacillaceae bacterium]|nr:hypothetical protein EBB07_13410 [Paenibacillaceae bacterium]